MNRHSINSDLINTPIHNTSPEARHLELDLFQLNDPHLALNLLGASTFYQHGNGGLNWLNHQSATHLLQCAANNLPDKDDLLYAHMNTIDKKRRRNKLKNLSWDGQRYKLHYHFQNKQSDHIWIEEQGQRLQGTGTHADIIFCVIRQLDNEPYNAAELSRQTYYDELSLLWNDRRLQEGLEYLRALSLSYEHKPAFIALRLQNFMHLNDTHGYDACTRLIQAMAKRLRQQVRPSDMLARLNEIDFAVALPHSPPTELHTQTQQLITILSQSPYTDPCGPLEVQISATSLSLPDYPDFSPRQIIGLGQFCLDSNAEHVNGYLPCEAELITAFKNTHALHIEPEVSKDELCAILKNNGFSFDFQPIVQARSRKHCYYEASLQFKRATGKIYTASHFMPLIETTKLSSQLDSHALNLAHTYLQNNASKALTLPVSAQTIEDNQAANAYITQLKHLHPYIDKLILQLNESIALQSPNKLSRFCAAAHQIGIRFTIDDFGASYTTFKSLMTIEADMIKIDSRFTDNILQTPNKQSFVRMCVDMAKTFGMKTMTKQITDHNIADWLMHMGIDYLQGPIFALEGSEFHQSSTSAAG